MIINKHMFQFNSNMAKMLISQFVEVMKSLWTDRQQIEKIT